MAIAVVVRISPDVLYPCTQTAFNASREAARKKNSGYLGLESHFHADASCQTPQIYNYKRDQWQLSNHVLISY